MSHKKIAIVQSNYIPWKGYFDLINSVDEFILFDDVQYTTRDWRNRNRIKTQEGPIWLTIPIKHKFRQKISEAVISDDGWPGRHWKSIAHNYARAEYFRAFRDQFEELYFAGTDRFLSLVNFRFLAAICRILDITTKMSWAADYHLVEGKTERLVELCRQAGATEYVSGPAAKSYLNEGMFAQASICVTYMDYSGYPEYPQLYPPFDPFVSVIDLIFNTGPNARQYMKSFGQD